MVKDTEVPTRAVNWRGMRIYGLMVLLRTMPLLGAAVLPRCLVATATTTVVASTIRVAAPPSGPLLRAVVATRGAGYCTTIFPVSTGATTIGTTAFRFG